MVLSAGVILLILWLLGFLFLKKVVGGLIHVVLIVAVIAIAWYFFGGG